jgi:hypothetical protein
MPFAVPFSRDVGAYIAQAEADVQNTILLGGPHDPMSLALASLLGQSRALMEGHIEKLISQNLWDWDAMPCDLVYANGAKLGIPLRGPAYAIGNALLTGDAGTAIPVDLTVNGPGTFGLDFTRTCPSMLDASGVAYVPIVSQVAGKIGNAVIPTQGVLGVATAGINTLVTYVQTNGGLDQETCDDYRARLKIVDALDRTPGSVGWHQFRAMRYPGVTRTCPNPYFCCDGQVSVFVFADGLFPDGIPDALFLENLQAKVFDTQIGSSPLGSRIFQTPTGVANAAMVGDVRIVVQCAKNITADQQQAAQRAAIAFFGSLCPGAAICKSLAINAMLVYVNCVGSLRFEYDSTKFTEDQTNITPAPGVLPKLTGVSFTV